MLQQYGHNFAAFSPSEQSCIAQNIRDKKAEGWDEDRAIAASIRICAPAKSTAASMSAVTLNADEVQMTSMPGGEYRWSRNDDGTYNIYDLPMMALLKKGEKGAPADMQLSYLSQCIEWASMKLNEKYIAPLHIQHHKPFITNDRTEPAGRVLPKRLASITLNQQEIPVIVGDLLYVQEESFKEIAAGRLPYVSPELPPWGKPPRILSLALLPTESPFFAFEMLTLGPEVIRESVLSFSELEPLIACCDTVDDRHILLFKFAGGSMPVDIHKDEKKKTEGESVSLMGKHDTKQEGGVDIGMAFRDMHKALKTLSAHFGHSLEEEEKKNEKMTHEPGHKEKEGEKMMGEHKDLKPAEQQKPKEEGMVASDDRIALSAEVGAKLAEQAGEIAALKSVNSKRETSDKMTTLVDSAMVTLAEYNPTDDLRKELATMAEGGEVILNTFVESYKRTTPKDPPKTLRDFEGRGTTGAAKNFAVDPNAPAEVLAFADEPEKLAKATEFADQFKKLEGYTTGTLESFIENQFEHEERQTKLMAEIGATGATG